MGRRGRGRTGPWPGRGPFRYLPPWQRPGWLSGFGRSFSMQPRSSTHGNCANFRDGLCTLYGVSIDPNGAACLNFTPKSKTTTSQPSRAYSKTRQYYQPYPPQTMQGYPPYKSPPQIGYLPMPNYLQHYPYTSFLYPYPYPPWIEYGSPHMIDPWDLLQAEYPHKYGPRYWYPYSMLTYPSTDHIYGQHPLTHVPMAPPLRLGYLEEQRSVLEQQVNTLQEELKRVEKRLRELKG